MQYIKIWKGFNDTASDTPNTAILLVSGGSLKTFGFEIENEYETVIFLYLHINVKINWKKTMVQ